MSQSGVSTKHPGPIRNGIGLACLVAALALAGDATADRLSAGGVTLSGKTKSVTAKGVEFQPDFAKDPMLVPWDKVEDLSTEGRQQVLYGEDQEVDAPISGYHDGKLAIGDATVETKEIVSVVAMAEEQPSFYDRTRSAFRYWHGGFDFGFNLQRATDDNLGLLVAFHTLRAKGPTRLMLGADYRYLEEEPKNSPERRTKDAASGLVRGEYDFTKSIYGYASTDFLYDAVQNLNLRAVPKAGAGWTVWQREPKEGLRDFFALELGGGWIYEKYMPPDPPTDPTKPHFHDENSYFTVAFGAAAAYLLPRGAAFDWRFDYLPSVSDWADDYIVRTVAGFSVPLIGPVSARLSIADTYDSTPAEGSDENSLYFDTTLSLNW